MDIYCCSCKKTITGRLTDGLEVYPHRNDLKKIPIWICDECSNFVGCHHKTKNKTKPLGCIPTPEIKEARKAIHEILDPIWKNGGISRKDLYAIISNFIGWEFHTAKIKSIEEARDIYRLLIKLTANYITN